MSLAISDPALRDEQRERYRGFRSQFVAAVFDPEHWTRARQRRHIREVVRAAMAPP